MKTVTRLLLLCGVALLVTSCASLGYYTQAAHGQLSLMAEARPIDEWLADPAVDLKLKTRLAKAKEMRRFAVRELGLPDNGSYTTYADLKRPYVLWNVVATPELSLEPLQWCFPIAGCVNYRGYYDSDEARAYGAELRREGYDVQVGGVAAYSTLGWFNDPLLSTFMHYPDGELARLVFHELAHQVVYVQDDSQFNESFATAVEEAGIDRWMALQADDKMRIAYVEYEGRKHDFLTLLLKYRKQLEASYARDASDAEKRKQKADVFRALKDEYQTLKTAWGGYRGYDRWFAEPLSNAHLASIATYHDLVPGFRALLAREKNFPAFYEAVKELAHLGKAERHRRLAAMAGTTFAAAGH